MEITTYYRYMLSSCATTSNHVLERTHSVFLFIEHEGGDGPTGIGTGTGLALDMDSSAAPAILILSSRDGVSRHWHDEVGDRRRR